MNVLLPSAATTLFVSAVLLGICLYLYYQEGDKALRIWAFAWFLFLLRAVGTVLVAFYPGLAAFHALNHTLNVLFALAMLAGVQRWAQVVVGRTLWVGVACAAGVWELTALGVKLPHLWESIPTTAVAAGIASWSGVIILRSPRRRGNLGANLLVVAFGLWACHTLDHPLSWESEWFAPWDAELDAFFVLLFSIATWLLYYGESRRAFVTEQASYSTLVAQMPTVFWRLTGEYDRQLLHLDHERKEPDQPVSTTAWAESVHPDDFARFRQICGGAIGQREPFSVEYRMRGEDGGYRWVKDDGTPVFDREGRYAGYVGVATDITGLKETEGKLLERERRLDALFSKASDAIYVSTMEGRFVEVNDQACRIAGYSREELMALGVAGIDANPDTPGQFGQIVSSYPERTSWLIATVHRRKDGSTYPVEVKIDLIELGNGPVIMGVARDLSQRIAEETRYAQILSTTIDGLLVCDYDGNILEANRATSAMLGYSVSELLQMTVADIDPTMEAGEIRARTDMVRAHGYLRFEAVHRRKDGVILDVDVSVSHDPALPGQIMCFTRDITEKKRSEAALRRSESFLRRSQAVGHIGSWELDPASGELTISREFHNIFQLPKDSPLARLADVVPLIAPADWRRLKRAFVGSIRRGRKGGEVEFRIRVEGGAETRILTTRFEHVMDTSGIVVLTTGVVQDVTKRRREERISAARLRIMDYSRHEHSSHDLLQTFLDEAEKLTGSTIGFFHFVEPDGETLSLQAWSTNTLAHMCHAEGEGLHYPISQAGVWADCAREGRVIIHNDYASLPNKRGLPAGHAPIIRQMVVPVYRAGKVVAILGVGNKEAYYTEEDAENVAYLADIAWDNVVRMRAEEALRASEAKFSRVFWNAPFLMSISSMEDGRYIEVNDAFSRATGYAPEDIIGSGYMELGLLTEEVRDQVRALLDAAGEVRNLEIPCRRADGTNMPLIYSGVLVEVGGLQSLLSTGVDITQRKEAEEAVRLQNRSITLGRNIATAFLTPRPGATLDQLLSVILEALESRFGLLGWVDGSGNLVCPAMSEVFRNEQVPDGAPVVHPRGRWAGIWEEAIRTQRVVIANERPDVPLGDLQLDNAIAAPLLHLGVATGVLLLANRLGGYGDTESELLENAAHQAAPLVKAYLEHAQKEKEREQLEAQFRQAQKMEAIGQLTGGVAHDFNNLLHVILSCSDIIQEGIVPLEESGDILSQISEAATRAAQLVSQLLLFSRRQIMRPEALQLNEVLLDLMKMLSRIIGEHFQVQWHPSSHSRRIRGDRGMVEQVLTNLCVNARDAMPEGGVITIATDEVRFTGEDCADRPDVTPGDYAVLRISDTGFGMEESVISRIFEPFFTTKGVGKGTGLGLATVYGIVKQHGGFVDVQSELGVGSIFSTYWPVAAADDLPEAESGPVETVAAPGGTETLLLAEDDALVRGLTRQILESAGYTVLCASNGQDAVRLLEEHQDSVCLAILDIVMPELSGHAAYSKMQELRPDLPVLYASGYNEEAIHQSFVLDSDVTLIQKPYTRKALLMAVREVLAGAAASHQAHCQLQGRIQEAEAHFHN